MNCFKPQWRNKAYELIKGYFHSCMHIMSHKNFSSFLKTPSRNFPFIQTFIFEIFNLIISLSVFTLEVKFLRIWKDMKSFNYFCYLDLWGNLLITPRRPSKYFRRTERKLNFFEKSSSQQLWQVIQHSSVKRFVIKFKNSRFWNIISSCLLWIGTFHNSAICGIRSKKNKNAGKLLQRGLLCNARFNLAASKIHLNSMSNLKHDSFHLEAKKINKVFTQAVVKLNPRIATMATNFPKLIAFVLRQERSYNQQITLFMEFDLYDLEA